MFGDTERPGRLSLWKMVLGGFIAFVIVILAISVLFTGSFNRAQSNEWGCLYGGGLTEDKGLKEVVAPGKSGGFTLADKFVTIPSDDRIYAIDQDPKTQDFGGNPIIAPAKGTQADSTGIVQVDIPVQARFTINENVCELYQNYLRKYGTANLNFDGTDNPDAPGGWATFLNLQFNQTLIATIRPQVAGFTYIQLYNDFGLYADIQQKTSLELSRQLRSSLGGDFFCGPSYVFDGKADGKLDGGGCPPIEIVIKQITPTDGKFIENLKTIVANQEEQKVIQSNKDKAVAQALADQQQTIAQTNADKEKALAQTSADTEKALAQTQADQERAIAATEADKEKAIAQTEATKEKEVAQAKADEEAQLAEVGKDKAVEVATVEKNQLIADATIILATSQTAAAVERVKSETAFCQTLATINVNCADYMKAINWRPTIVFNGEGTGPATSPTVVLDAR